MWKPRNKWQLQTKGGCESSEGGSSNKPMIINYAHDGKTYLEPGLTISDFIGATIVTSDTEWNSVNRAFVEETEIGHLVTGITLVISKGVGEFRYNYNPGNGLIVLNDELNDPLK